jgi:uncharacterized phiE125 gp8 family phage protein
MITSQVDTEPAGEPITVDDLKTHLRITGNDEDLYLSSLAITARLSAEEYTGKKFINTTMEGYLPAIPTGDNFMLLPGPVSSITEIQSYDTEDSGTVWSSDNYSLNIYGNVPHVQRNHGVSWPNATRTWNPIYVKWVAGYGALRSDVPAAIRHALLLLASHFWENRMPLNIGNIVNPIPEMHQRLLYPYRTMVFGFQE